MMNDDGGGDSKEQAQAPYKPTFVRLGRLTWFTLESSFRADPERCEQLEKRLVAVKQRVDHMADMRISWMMCGKFDQRLHWTDDEWVAFLRSWKPMSVNAFGKIDELNPEEKKLLIAFTQYWTFYACCPETPKLAGSGETVDMTIEQVAKVVEKVLDEKNDYFSKLGDPLQPCTCCGKNAVGHKLYRCSRCKNAYYCSVDCQRLDWKKGGHKAICKQQQQRSDAKQPEQQQGSRDQQEDTKTEYSTRSMAFTNATTMRLFADLFIKSGMLKDGRPFTLEVYDALSDEEKRAVLANAFILEWDSMSQEKKIQERSNMPPECNVCGMEKESSSPDASVGYTRLICSNCQLFKMLYLKDDE